jgi:hypothetical protein
MFIELRFKAPDTCTYQRITTIKVFWFIDLGF